MTKQMKRLRLLISISVCLNGMAGLAEEPSIFKWTDEAGRVHYSTSASHPEAAPASLPAIGREDIDSKISELRSNTPITCDSRGGVNCAAGADDDGSVVCADGFRDAEQRFRFACLEARLQAGRPELVYGRNLQDKVNAPPSLRVVLRNLAGVKAEGIEVSFTGAGLKGRLNAVGPQSIDPFGLGEYEAPLAAVSAGPDPKKIHSKVYCKNCSAVLDGR